MKRSFIVITEDLLGIVRTTVVKSERDQHSACIHTDGIRWVGRASRIVCKRPLVSHVPKRSIWFSREKPLANSYTWISFAARPTSCSYPRDQDQNGKWQPAASRFTDDSVDDIKREISRSYSESDILWTQLGG